MPRRVAAVALVVLAGIAGDGRPADAQVFDVSGGSSSLFDAHGGTVSVRDGSSSFSAAAGRLGDRFVLGLLATRVVRRMTFTFGDQQIEFRLPTDPGGGGRYVPLRGAAVELQRGPTTLRVVVGAIAQRLGAPFLRAARSESATGLAVYERQLGDRWRISSWAIAARQATAIQSVSAHLTPPLTFGVSGGVGSSHPYLASSAAWTSPRVRATTSVIAQGVGFNRVAVEGPASAEETGANASLVVRPSARVVLTGSRQTLVDPLAAGARGTVAVHQAGAGMNAGGFRANGAVYSATGDSRPSSRGVSLTVGRPFGPRTDVSVEQFYSRAALGEQAHSGIVRAQHVVSPRLTLTGALTRTNGQTSWTSGGEFLSNPLRLGVSYQTVFVPLRPRSPFMHTIGVDAQVVVGGVTLRANTYVTPLGSVRYTVSGALLRARFARDPKPVRARLLPLVVRGEVHDANGDPVAGAVVSLADAVVITDAAGRFLYRTSSRHPLVVRVRTDEFLSPGRFEPVSVPSTLTPVHESDAVSAVLIVRRI